MSKNRKRNRKKWSNARGVGLTDHATERMRRRGVQMSAVDAALRFGRLAPRPGNAVVYAIGRYEITEAAAEGIDISRHNGVQVVVTTRGDRRSEVITVYRNRDLKSLHGRKSWRREKSEK